MWCRAIELNIIYEFRDVSAADLAVGADSPGPL